MKAKLEKALILSNLRLQDASARIISWHNHDGDCCNCGKCAICELQSALKSNQMVFKLHKLTKDWKLPKLQA